MIRRTRGCAGPHEDEDGFRFLYRVLLLFLHDLERKRDTHDMTTRHACLLSLYTGTIGMSLVELSAIRGRKIIVEVIQPFLSQHLARGAWLAPVGRAAVLNLVAEDRVAVALLEADFREYGGH